MKVKRMILILLVLFSILPLILITGFSVERYASQSMKLINQNIQTAAQINANHLQNFFERLESNMRADIEMPEIENLIAADSDTLEQAKQMATQMLRVRVESQPFLRSASIVGTDNLVISSTDPTRVGKRTLFSDDYLANVYQGGFHVTDIQTNEGYQNGVRHLAMSYPISEYGEFKGLLVVVADMSYFEELVQSTSFFETGNVTVLDSKGTVAATNSSFLTTSIDSVQQSDLPSQWKKLDLKQNPSGLIPFSVDGNRYFGCYSELSGTGWFVFTGVDYSELTMPVWVVLAGTLGLLLVLILLILLSSRFLNRYFSHPLEQIVCGIEQMRRNDHTARISYDKQNEFGKISAAFNELMDHIEEDNRELRTSETRYRILTEQADSVIYEYNLQDHTIYHSANWSEKFGYEPVRKNFLEATVAKKIVHKDDQEKFLELFESFANGERLHGRVEIRLCKSDGSYLWCSVLATVMSDESGAPYRVIGTITDIDRQKRETKILKDKAERDLLTGLYNRATTEALIRRYLDAGKRGDMHALVVVDIDNFKAVNDNLGHLFGDAVLSEISAKLLSIFRVSDVVGRIGGDEFVVFLNHLPSKQLLYERLNKLIEVFRHSYTGHNREYKISGSIGAAIYPQDGKSYQELFSNADSALYAAKNRGKDCYQVYDATVCGQHYTGRTTRTPERQKSFQENVSEYIFQILYQTSDINSAVQMILDIVGRYYNVSRAYVFEYTEDGNFMNNTFEWCNTGIKPQIANLQNIDNALVGNYSDYFKDSNVLYVKDINELNKDVYEILKPQGIFSMLQCAILDDGEFRGYVGFDECNKLRLWTQDEIDTLAFVSRILSIFLVKMRTQHKLERSLEQTRSILDTQDMWTYVVDRETYELLFINQKTRTLAPEAKLGDKCYQAFWNGRTTPCERCPMTGVDQAHPHCTMSIFNDHFQVWTSATASPLAWNGRENVCLICCIDTTHLERPPQEECR